MIYRCQYNGGWIQNCYGDKALELVGSNPVSCSGVSLGSRNAIIVYVRSYLFICYSYILYYTNDMMIVLYAIGASRPCDKG